MQSVWSVIITFMLANSQSAQTTDLLSLWEGLRVLKDPPACLVHSDVADGIARLKQQHGDRLRVEVIGRSFERREIRLLTLGEGDRNILLWSQMHGDEPSATPALLDLANYLLTSDDPQAQSILESFTLLMVPMLNPDGAERGTRRSAQLIDINRDALHLATPEGRLLKRIRDQYEPFLGFNLHDQDRRKLVGDTDVLATQSVLAVSGDESQTLTDGRRRAMRVCSVLVDAFQPYIPGGVGRFNEDWNPRAFGDNVTAWGTPVVLLESGGLPPSKEFSYLTGLTFVGLVRSLTELAKNDALDFDLDTYRELPRNRSDALVDVMLQNASILESEAGVVRRSFGDVAFQVNYDERGISCASRDRGQTLASLIEEGNSHRGSTIVEIGDAATFEALRSVDLNGGLLLPAFDIGVEGFRARRWLDDSAMEDWARLGVSKVVWRVKPKRWQGALELAKAINGVDRPRLEVTVDRSALPSLVVQAPPSRLGKRTLGEVAAALLGAKAGSEPDVGKLLTSLSPIRRFGQASFVLLSGGTGALAAAENSAARTGEEISVSELATLTLRQVWLRGRELR